MEFSAYGLPLGMVTSIRYLGRVISAADNNCPSVVRNLAKASVVWKSMAGILSREGPELWVSRFLFKAMVRAVLLFGAETRVVNSRVGRVLGGFQDQVARRLKEELLWRWADRNWEYTLTETSME